MPFDDGTHYKEFNHSCNSTLIADYKELCQSNPSVKAINVIGAISTNKYLPRWFYYNDGYYSLLHNQPCCLWRQCYNGKYVLAFRFMERTQTREMILYFNTPYEFKEFYLKQLYTT